jgi:hypothetical protein
MFTNAIKNSIKGIRYIEPIKIRTIRNKGYLMELEKQYDDFLDKNQQILMLLETIYDYLDVRDAIRLQVQRLEIEDKKKEIYKNVKKEKEIKYDRTFHLLIEPELRLTEEQIQQGYAATINEPKEYKCGCASIRYKHPDSKSNDINLNDINLKDINLKDINLNLYCDIHIGKKKLHDELEIRLKTVKRELSRIKRKGNRVDAKKRSSKYPWKNV